MFSIMKRHVIVGAMLMSAVMALSQTQVERETLSVQGYQGQARVIRNQGRVFVDVEELARMLGGVEVTEEELIDYCRERLAHYKCPQSIEFCESLPKTATGKIRKNELRARTAAFSNSRTTPPIPPTGTFHSPVLFPITW